MLYYLLYTFLCFAFILIFLNHLYKLTILIKHLKKDENIYK